MSFITSPALVSYVNSLNAVVPNNGVPVAAFQAIGPYASIDAALSPKGQGALLAQIPDSLNTGGNKRGVSAVDWQMSRTAPTMIAQGQYSTIGGGQNNTASGSQSVVAGGAGNNAVGAASVVAGGGNNQASSTTEQGTTVGGGTDNLASADYSTIPGGQGGYTRGVKGLYAYASYGGGVKASGGRFQITALPIDVSTANATPTVACRLASLGAVPDATNVFALAPNQTVWISGVVVARLTGTGDSASWTFTCLARRGASAASTALVAAAVITAGPADAGAAGLAVAVAANTTRGSVEVTVTGLAATNVNWTVRMDGTEVAN